MGPCPHLLDKRLLNLSLNRGNLSHKITEKKITTKIIKNVIKHRLPI